MKTVGSQKKKQNLPEQKQLIEFCLGCRNRRVRIFDEPCWTCHKDYYSQPLRPRKPLNYIGGGVL